MKYPVIGAALLSLATATASVHAADAAAPAIVGNIALNSNYMFRAISQTNNIGEVSGGLDYQHSSGVYIGTWGSNISFASSLEMDFYGGSRGSITPGEIARGSKSRAGFRLAGNVLSADVTTKSEQNSRWRVNPDELSKDVSGQPVLLDSLPHWTGGTSTT